MPFGPRSVLDTDDVVAVGGIYAGFLLAREDLREAKEDEAGLEESASDGIGATGALFSDSGVGDEAPGASLVGDSGLRGFAFLDSSAGNQALLSEELTAAA